MYKKEVKCELALLDRLAILNVREILHLEAYLIVSLLMKHIQYNI